MFITGLADSGQEAYQSYLYHRGNSFDELWRVDTFSMTWWFLLFVGLLSSMCLLLELYAISYDGCATIHLSTNHSSGSLFFFNFHVAIIYYLGFFFFIIFKLIHNVINRFPLHYFHRLFLLTFFHSFYLVVAISLGAKLL